LAEFVQQTNLDRGALGDAEFVIGHGNTLPKRSGVALSFCNRPVFSSVRDKYLGHKFLTFG
ncbi:hypothetical protein, partial [Azotobacter chroococcum]|uniref:hypothetical protein n=1 Tax=Azotobacter chroococcum TaxID=353 RepID=UPI001A95537B